MSKLQIRQQTFAKRCEICHQTDLFDAEKNFCLRCIAVKDLSTKAYDTSRTTNSYSGMLLLSNNIELMTLIQIGAIVCSLVGIFIEIRAILLIGPILSAIGGVIAWSSYCCKIRLGILWGLSSVIITVFCLSLILIFGWLPNDARIPIQIIATIYAIMALPVGISILLNLNRRNPNGTFVLKTEKSGLDEKK